MSRPFEIRYPFAPLRDIVDRREELTTEQIAEQLGVHPRQLLRYMEQGITDSAADRLAVHAGTHPCVIWPEWGHAAVGAG